MKPCPTCQQLLPDNAKFCPSDGTSLASAAADPLLGSVIAERYLIQERIGEGGSGIIYRAEHVALRSRLAIKMLHHQLSQNDSAVERFREEATRLAQLDSDNIVRVSDFGRAADDRLFFAMEFLEGETLATKLAREGKIAEKEAIDLLEQVSDALTDAHELGIVHGDLRPRNIFLTKKKRRIVVKLLDFGLAKLTETPTDHRQAKKGERAVVDPRYMSPEQARGEALTQQSDIYSMGIIAYEIAAGAPPFVGSGTFDVLTKHLEAKPVPLNLKIPSISRPFAQSVARALRKKADERFSSVERFLKALCEEAPVEDTAAERAAAAKRRAEVKPSAAAKPSAKAPPATEAPPPATAPPTEPSIPATTAPASPTAKDEPSPRSNSGSPAAPAMVTASAEPAKTMLGVGLNTKQIEAMVKGTEPKPSDTAPLVSAASKLPAAATIASAEAPGSGGGKNGERPAAKSDPSVQFSDADTLGSHTGNWFAEGVAAEQQLKSRTKSAPLPAIYGDIDEIEPPRRAISPGLVILGVVIAAALVLGAVLFWSGGDDPPTKKQTLMAKTTIHSGDGPGVGAQAAPPKTDPPKTDPPKTDPSKTDPSKTDPSKTDPSKTDPPKTDPPKTDPLRPAPPRPAPPRPAPPRPAPPRPAPPRPRVVVRHHRKPAPPKPKRDVGQAMFHVKMGKMQLRKGAYTRARTEFNLALKLDPRSGGAHGGLGEVAFEEGKYGAAVKHLRKAVRINPRNTRYLVMLGNVYFKRRKLKQAITQYRRALKYRPNNAEARSSLQAAVRRLAGN